MSYSEGSDGPWDSWNGWPIWPEPSNQDNEVEKFEQARFDSLSGHLSSQYTCDDLAPLYDYIEHASMPHTSPSVPPWYTTHAVHDQATFSFSSYSPLDHAVHQYWSANTAATPQRSRPQQVQLDQETNHDDHALDMAVASAQNPSRKLPSYPIVNTTYPRTRADPPQRDVPGQPKPYRQTSRFDGDEYTARWVRGEGSNRAGWCGICSSWHKLKDSAYWYHMHYSHGISCATGKPFDAPQGRRDALDAVGFEAQCGRCSEWVYVGRSDRWQTPYYRHAYKCQVKHRPNIDRPRSRHDSTSPHQAIVGHSWLDR